MWGCWGILLSPTLLSMCVWVFFLSPFCSFNFFHSSSHPPKQILILSFSLSLSLSDAFPRWFTLTEGISGWRGESGGSGCYTHPHIHSLLSPPPIITTTRSSLHCKMKNLIIKVIPNIHKKWESGCIHFNHLFGGKVSLCDQSINQLIKSVKSVNQVKLSQSVSWVQSF